MKLSNRLGNLLVPGTTQKESSLSSTYQLAFEPNLIPPLSLMRTEGIDVIEEWFRWGEEWSMLLRFYGGITRTSSVLEIGCGFGRIAFPLRYVLSAQGAYDGFEICRYKVDFLENFHKAHPNFKFTWADVSNKHYNSAGQVEPEQYCFPYADNSFDIIFAASVFTHLLPEASAHYFAEAARVLKPGGKCVFSFFLLDYYQKGAVRPLGFSRPVFNVDHSYGDYGDSFAVSDPKDPEAISAYKISAVEQFADEAGLKFSQAPVPGLWTGTVENWVGSQDLVVLTKE